MAAARLWRIRPRATAARRSWPGGHRGSRGGARRSGSRDRIQSVRRRLQYQPPDPALIRRRNDLSARVAARDGRLQCRRRALEASRRGAEDGRRPRSPQSVLRHREPSVALRWTGVHEPEPAHHRGIHRTHSAAVWQRQCAHGAEEARSLSRSTIRGLRGLRSRHDSQVRFRVVPARQPGSPRHLVALPASTDAGGPRRVTKHRSSRAAGRPQGAGWPVSGARLAGKECRTEGRARTQLDRGIRLQSGRGAGMVPGVDPVRHRFQQPDRSRFVLARRVGQSTLRFPRHPQPGSLVGELRLQSQPEFCHDCRGLYAARPAGDRRLEIAQCRGLANPGNRLLDAVSEGPGPWPVAVAAGWNLPAQIFAGRERR